MKGELRGDLAAYEKFGLFQRSVNQNTAYRYRGALLRYQVFLGENPPSLSATYEYLGSLRKNGFDPATLRVYRAALSGYHQFRGEELKFKVKVPDTSAKYVPWEIIQKMLALASAKPHDELILRLMADGGLRRDEVVNLKISNIEGNSVRFRGKGDKQRTVPMTAELRKLVDKFSAGRPKDESLVGLGEKGIYLMVKRYGALAGMPAITPHDLRRALGTHLLKVTGNIRIVQEILGHSNVNTTQAYTAVTLADMEEAVKRLNNPIGVSEKMVNSQGAEEKEQVSGHRAYEEEAHKMKMRELARKLADRVNVPSLWDKDLLRDIPAEFKAGKYSLILGLIEIDKGKRVKVKCNDIGTGIAETHLVNALFSHLNTSGISKFAELVGNKSKLDNLRGQVEQYYIALLTLLNLITGDVEAYQTKVNFDDEIKPGFTKWFALTSWIDALQNAGGLPWIEESWYSPPESIPGTNLLQLRCGSYIIASAESKETLSTYENWHKEIRLQYSKNNLTQDIAIKYQRLNESAQDIKQRLQEFSDVEHLPGHCGL